jgi:hypothetical protein
VVDLEEHIDLEEWWGFGGLCRRSIGHISWSAYTLDSGVLLMDVFTLDLDMCHLERECSTYVELGCL